MPYFSFRVETASAKANNTNNYSITLTIEGWLNCIGFPHRDYEIQSVDFVSTGSIEIYYIYKGARTDLGTYDIGESLSFTAM